jgi:hypothetical protein
MSDAVRIDARCDPLGTVVATEWRVLDLSLLPDTRIVTGTILAAAGKIKWNQFIASQLSSLNRIRLARRPADILSESSVFVAFLRHTSWLGAGEHFT